MTPVATTLQEPSPPIDESFKGLAKTAIAQGQEAQGIAYLAADAVVTGNEEVLGSLRWSATLKRPILAIRWGLATIVTQANKGGEAKAKGDAPPAPAGGAIASPSGNIFSNGTGGLATVQAATPTPTPTPTPPPAARPAKKRPSDVSGAEAKTDYSISDPAAFWRQNVGAPLVEMLETHLNHGDFGSWFKDSDRKVAATNVGVAGPTVPGAMVPGQDAPLQSPPAAGNQPPPLLSASPGMTLMEGATLSELRAAALRENLDFILFAQIGSKTVRTGPTQSLLDIHIIELCKGAEDWVARPTVNHVRIMAAQQATTGKDKQENPLPALLKTIQMHMDRQTKLEDMPTIEHEALLKRAAALVAMKAKNPLPALLELRYYQWKKALSDQEFADYAAKLAGADDSHRLATGTDAERKQVVDQWLNAAQKE